MGGMNTLKLAVLSALSAGACAVFAAAPWEDPAVNAINRLPARGISVPCESEEIAIAIAQGQRPKGDSTLR